MKTDASGLGRLGYNQYFDDSRTRLGATVEQLARVTAEHKGAYEVMGETGAYRAAVTGKRMLTAQNRDDFPAVGDWVVTRNVPGDTKVILEVLPRRTTLHKKYGGKDEAQLIAANIDAAFIVESIDRDYNLNRFERYLVLAREGGVKPVIILNKSDLGSDVELERKFAEIHERFGEVDVLATSTTTASGLDELEGYIEAGLTYCFLGSSGVGKSSLINRLLEQDSIVTKAIGAKTGRGRHTTTTREMYLTSTGGIIIDNPGSREVGVVNAQAGLEEVFIDIEAIARTCNFPDCQHMTEPGCAVAQALKTGKIDASQFENYQKLRKETEHYELSTYGKRQKDKKFGKYIKNVKDELKKHAAD